MTLRHRARAWRLGLPRPRRRAAIPTPRRHAAIGTRRRWLFLAAVASLGLALFGGWMWFRDSSFVAVDHVTIAGADGPDGPAIRTALRAAARNTTTLDVPLGHLRRAVSPFPEVKDVRASAQFPHRLTIRVIERLPVAVVQVAGRQIPVAGDGTLLRGLAVASPLPVLAISVPPVGRRLTEHGVADVVAVLAAAPYRLLSQVSQVSRVSGHGLVAQIRGGPSLYFGSPTELTGKWIAASEVLADPGAAGASYIDVTNPGHPAAGDAGSPALGASTASSSGSGPSANTSSSGPLPLTGAGASTGSHAATTATGGG